MVFVFVFVLGELMDKARGLRPSFFSGGRGRGGMR